MNLLLSKGSVRTQMIHSDIVGHKAEHIFDRALTEEHV